MFLLFYTEEMLDKVVTYTNQKIAENFEVGEKFVPGDFFFLLLHSFLKIMIQTYLWAPTIELLRFPLQHIIYRYRSQKIISDPQEKMYTEERFKKSPCLKFLDKVNCLYFLVVLVVKDFVCLYCFGSSSVAMRIWIRIRLQYRYQIEKELS